MSEQHEHSKKVTIFRAGSFLSRAQGPNADLYFASSSRSIGSYFQNQNSSRIASGLTFDEENLLMPLILSVPVTDREFRKEVAKFYIDINTKVPYSTGLELEIGLEKGNDVPLSADNLPIALSDYLRYRHAKGHPEVASNKEEADGSSLISYYIFDASEANKENTRKTDIADAAMQIYLTIKPDEKKVTMMLTLLGIDPREFTEPNKVDKMTTALRTQAEEKASRFIEIYKDAHLETRYWITTMINTGLLKKIGTKHLVAETDKLLGNTMEETIYYFKDEANSDMVGALKAQLQEHMKKVIKKRPSPIKR